jgi:hypothetical protein
MPLLQHIGQFLWAIGTNWLVLMSGFVSALFELLSRSGRAVGHRWWWGVAAFCVFVASFQVWLQEKEKNETCLEGTIEETLSGETRQWTMPNGKTVMFPKPRALPGLEIAVANTCGPATIVEGFHAEIQSRQFLKKDIRPLLIPETFPWKNEQGQTILTLHQSTTLGEKLMRTPLAAGLKVRGWEVYLTDLSAEEIARTGWCRSTGGKAVSISIRRAEQLKDQVATTLPPVVR